MGIKRCWESHKPYAIEHEGGTYYIQGGSCTGHYPKDVDVFIGFDNLMVIGERGFPWVDGIDISYPIEDGSVPTKVDNFIKLVDWTQERLIAGDKIYCGCIGGHGRTGLFLAALTKVMSGKKDAITIVRENYCKKAVESKTQVEWLNKHFGITKQNGSKQLLPQSPYNHPKSYGDYYGGYYGGNNSFKSGGVIDNKQHSRVDGYLSHGPMQRYYPVSGSSIFNDK